MDEPAIGVSGYLTTTPPLKGRVKASPEDFVVNEVSVDLPHVADGRYTVARIRTRNWETNRLVRELARRLRISRKRIAFAGTKDRRAITTQLFQFDAPVEVVASIRLKDVEVLETFRTDRVLKIGDLRGNEFAITVRDIPLSSAEVERQTEPIVREIRAAGGFPNFFGVQRFGSVRPITHVVGRHIVRGEFKEAVHAYVANPMEGEGDESAAVRAELEATGDYGAALRRYPLEWGFEKAILNHLVRDPDDFVGALQILPDNLQMMFVHGYQSYLFNRILSERMHAGLPLHEPVEGDIVLATRPDGRPDRRRQIPVDCTNIERVMTQCRAGHGIVSGLLFGSESEFAAGRPGAIEKQIIAGESVRAEDFIIPQIPRLSSRGSRRELLAPVRNLSWEASDGTLRLRFTLTPGCYGTSLLREFLKAPIP